MKICPKCNQEKEHFDHGGYWCKECRSTYDKGWRAKNKEKVHAHQKKNIRTPETRFSHAKRLALKSNKEWSITLEQYRKLIVVPCHYCSGFFKINETGSGLDRTNNREGYKIDNVVSCCWTCNKIKNDTLTVDEATQLIRLLVRMRSADRQSPQEEK